MIYLFKRASSDLNRVLKTLGYDIAQAKHEYTMKTSLLEYFSESCLGLDDINRDEEVRFKLNDIFMALTDGDIERIKSHIERLEPAVKAMIPNSVLELALLKFEGKPNFNVLNINCKEYSKFVKAIAVAYTNGDVALAERIETQLYEFVKMSDLEGIDHKMTDDELLDICATYLKKCKDPEAKMIAFLINQSKA